MLICKYFVYMGFFCLSNLPWVYIIRIISSFVSKLGLRLIGKFHIIKYIRMLRMLKMTQSIFFIKLPGNNFVYIGDNDIDSFLYSIKPIEEIFKWLSLCL